MSNVGHSVTSQVATLVVNEDTVGPVLLSAVRDSYKTNITVVFDELLATNLPLDPFVFYLHNLTDDLIDNQVFATATLGPDGKTVFLTTMSPVTNGVRYTLGVAYAVDLAENEIFDQEVGLVLQAAFITIGADNLAALEAENADQVVPRVWESVERNWLFTAERAGYSGSGAMRAMPNTEGNRPGTNEATSLDFYVSFPDAGTYYLWVRGGAENGGDNSCHGGLDDVVPDSANNITQGFELPAGGYAWGGTKDGGAGVARTTLDVPTPGIHKVQIYMREDGFYCDKILLTLDPNYNPTAINGGLGPDQTPKEYTDVVIVLSIKFTAGGAAEISWNRGTLLEANSLDGQWKPVDGATSPWPVTPAPGETKFYKAVLSP